MPSRTKTTLSKPKLTLQLQAPDTKLATKPAPKLPISKSSASASAAASTEPDFAALDQYLFQSSQPYSQLSPPSVSAHPNPKRFQLRNLRRKLPHLPNAPVVEAPPAPSVSRRSHDTNNDDVKVVNIADLQSKLSLLSENLRTTQESLKKVEADRDLWKERAKALDRRSRYCAKENRDLKIRTTELQEQLRRKSSVIDEKQNKKDRDFDLGYKKNEILLPSHEESTAVKALITHHWNAQSEIAASAGKDEGSCDCVASKTINAILKDGSRRVSPTLHAEELVDEMQHSPNSMPAQKGDDKISNLALQMSPNPQSESSDESRKDKKEALKRRIKEVRGYVEGLKKENDVLESILLHDGANSGSESGDASSGSRRSEPMTKERAQSMIDE